MLKGIGASRGIGVGTVIVIKEHNLVFTPYKPTDIQAELDRFKETMELFKIQTMELVEDIKSRIGEHESKILEGQVMMISDPSLSMEIENSIKSGNCAEQAVSEVCNMFIQMFASIEDEMMRQRSSDIGDIKTRMLKLLLKVEDIKINELPKGSIIVAHDLTPSMTANIVKENVAGILTEVGGRTSHSAILARALEIPAVLSIDLITKLVKDGQRVIVDGTDGILINNPTPEECAEYAEKQRLYSEEKHALLQYFGKETITSDGTIKELFANIGHDHDVDQVLEYSGEGIGLFRTEFLFMDSKTMPSEEEQFKAYQSAASKMEGKTVIIRTLDVGGDKEIPYLDLEKEENPFLGYRAIRFCLKEEELYKTQLRALLRASAYGDIRIMIPMVTCVEELRKVRELIYELQHELDEKQIAYDKEIKVGIMIETPAACQIADLLAREADFFSIGTNDLTQYIMAVDRGNAKVEYLYSAYQPAVLRVISHVIACAKAENIPVGMCGESASDPLLIPLLVAFGLDEFSVSPTSILATRKAIANVSLEDACQLAQRVMKLATEAEVREELMKLK